jgi:hypothetical protein
MNFDEGLNQPQNEIPQNKQDANKKIIGIIDQNTLEQNQYLERRIKMANSVEDIVGAIISGSKGIKGSEKFYSTNDVISAIQRRIWFGEGYHHAYDSITRTYGLRDKVEELLAGTRALMENPKATERKIEINIQSAASIGEIIKEIYSHAGLMVEVDGNFKVYSAYEIARGIQYVQDHPEEGEKRYRYLTKGLGLRSRVRHIIEYQEAKK